MILYHTSDREIRHPDIHHGRKNADFGWGFYLTPDMDFACGWAGENAVLNEYAFEETGLEVHRFSRGTEWFSYIFHNRRLQDRLAADVIIGPVANDTIFDTLGIISSGYLKPEEASELLMIGPVFIQVALKTEKAASHLRWIRAERIGHPDSEALKAEQEAYQMQFAAALEKLTEAQEA